MDEPQYILDILSQPQALKDALPLFDFSNLKPLTMALHKGGFDRILLTGMGASYCAAYPAYLHLAQHGLPALWVNAAELLHSARALITPRTLLFIVSQSGRSAELLPLLDFTHHPRPAAILAVTNEQDSPAARAADAALLLHVQPEQVASTRSYTNTLALAQLAALALCEQPLEEHLTDLHKTAAALAAYLAAWEEHLAVIEKALGRPEMLVLLGRGASLAAAWCGALIFGEAAKYPSAVGLHAAEFRHGPLEAASPRLTALVFEGSPQTALYNRRMLEELHSYGAKAFWLSPQPGEIQPALPMPAAFGIGLPLVEMAPPQLLSVILAHQAGYEPGRLRHIDKVTTRE